MLATSKLINKFRSCTQAFIKIFIELYKLIMNFPCSTDIVLVIPEELHGGIGFAVCMMYFIAFIAFIALSSLPLLNPEPVSDPSGTSILEAHLVNCAVLMGL